MSVTLLSSFPLLTEEFKGIKITFYHSAQSIYDLLGRVDVIPLDRRTIYLPESESQSTNLIIERMLDLNQKLIERNFSPRFLAYDVGSGWVPIAEKKNPKTGLRGGPAVISRPYSQLPDTTNTRPSFIYCNVLHTTPASVFCRALAETLGAENPTTLATSAQLFLSKAGGLHLRIIVTEQAVVERALVAHPILKNDEAETLLYAATFEEDEVCAMLDYIDLSAGGGRLL